MTIAQFRTMEKSYWDETPEVTPETSISVAKWRMDALMHAFHWALDNGYMIPVISQPPTKPPCIPCNPQLYKED